MRFSGSARREKFAFVFFNAACRAMGIERPKRPAPEHTGSAHRVLVGAAE
jgi:hypothetical protein